jgi:hypothetical protein
MGPLPCAKTEPATATASVITKRAKNTRFIFDSFQKLFSFDFLNCHKRAIADAFRNPRKYWILLLPLAGAQ